MAGYYGRMREVFSQTPEGEVMLSSQQKGCLQERVAGGKTEVSFKAIKLQDFRGRLECWFSLRKGAPDWRRWFMSTQQRGIENYIKEAEKTFEACVPVACVTNDLGECRKPLWQLSPGVSPCQKFAWGRSFISAAHGTVWSPLLIEEHDIPTHFLKSSQMHFMFLEWAKSFGEK